MSFNKDAKNVARSKETRRDKFFRKKKRRTETWESKDRFREARDRADIEEGYADGRHDRRFRR